MHRNIFLVSCALFSWANAQFSSSEFPQCAVTCFTEVWPQSGCEITDTKCLCLNASYRNSFKSCAANTCSTSDYQTTVSQSLVICQNVGVTFTTSAFPTATGSSSSGSSSDSKTPPSSGLSAGSKIGLAAGIPCALIFFLSIGGLGLFLMRRQKKNQKKNSTTQHSPPEMILPPEMLPPPHMSQQQYPPQQEQMMGMGWQGTEHKHMGVEISGQQKYGMEMETHANRAELG